MFGALVLYFWFRSMALTNGHFTYGLDDAYIHLAIAKEMAFHGVWGNSSAGFSGVSSSLVWTILLAFLFKIFGNWELLPFLLNILFDLLLLWTLDLIWRRARIGSFWRIGLFILAFMIMPLASQPIIGMEVSLQCLLLSAFFYFVIFAKDSQNVWSEWPAILLAFLLGGVRYECILIVEICAVGFALQGKIKKAISVGVAGILPAVSYALFALIQKGTVIPNTLFLKSAAVEVLMKHVPIGGSSILVMLVAGLFFGFILFTSIRLIRKRFPIWRPSGTAIVFWATAITAIVQFSISSPEQQFERYRTYIYVALVILFGLFLRWVNARPSTNRNGNPLIGAMLLAASIAVFVPRFLLYLSKTPIASKNIWDQQGQMARFVERYCAKQPIVLVDIGAVSYYAHGPVIDLIGLGTDSIARMRLDRNDPSESVNRFIANQGAIVAMIYPIEQYEPDSSWEKEGSIVIQDRYVCARDTVDFYALRASDTGWLRSSLSDFRSRTTSEVLIY